MVITDIPDRLIDEGARVVEKLDHSGVAVTSAMWILFPDSEAWKLALSLPVVKKSGPRRGYELVQKALEELGLEVRGISLEDVTVLSPDDPLMRRLRGALKKGLRVSPLWFKGNVIEGELFPDALVYRAT
jgi:hypothetical protein